jgi:glutamate-1-semialdehyde 2,1-aminomutase
VAGRADIIERVNPRYKGQANYAYINGTLHGNPVAAAAGLATLEILEQPGFHEELHLRSDQLRASLQAVLDRYGVPAIASGKASFWQLLFMSEAPACQVDIMHSDTATMRRLDLGLLKQGIYVLPGVRRFVAAVTSQDDIVRTAEALDTACRAL